MPKSKVFFAKTISPEALLNIYNALQITLPGRIAVKLHSGEDGNQNYVRPEFVHPIIDKVGGTVVECNTAYGDIAGGVRDHTESHLRLIEKHGWNKYFKVDLMDAEGPDLKVPVRFYARLITFQRSPRWWIRRCTEANIDWLRLL